MSEKSQEVKVTPTLTEDEKEWFDWAGGKSQEEVAIELSKLAREAKMAGKDYLTELYNRAGIMNQLDHIKAEAVREKKKIFITFVDLDNLKKVNDTQTHEAGDKLLKDTARSMELTARGSDYLARWGGDEFLAIGLIGQADTPSVLESRLRENFALSGISASLASVEWNTNEPISNAIKLADSLMYKEKEQKWLARAIVR